MESGTPWFEIWKKPVVRQAARISDAHLARASRRVSPSVEFSVAPRSISGTVGRERWVGLWWRLVESALEAGAESMVGGADFVEDGELGGVVRGGDGRLGGFRDGLRLESGGGHGFKGFGTSWMMKRAEARQRN